MNFYITYKTPGLYCLYGIIIIMLRVIAGKHGGRKLEQPDLKISRPTTDRVKEAFFSMVQFKIEKRIFLDLFSGSGSIAIEAISRGAMKAIAVESNSKAAEVIQKNVDSLKIENIDIVKTDAVEFVRRSKGKKFDFIYMDPPFDKIKLFNDTISAIKEAEILHETGLLVIETSKPDSLELPEGFIVQRSTKYGKNNIVFIANII